MRFYSGELWGVSWSRHSWGVECSAMVRGGFGGWQRVARKYVGNGSDKVTVRDSVRAFRRDVLGGSRGAA
jgi:hypothetical protein